MNIKAERIKVELDADEAWRLAFHISHSLEASIDSYYIDTSHDSYGQGLEGHAKPLFEEHCRKDLDMMNKFTACACGDERNMERELWLYLETRYKEKNTKKEKV